MVLSKISSDPLHIDYANLYHTCWNLKKSSSLTLYSPFLSLTRNNLCISFDDVSDFPRSTLAASVTNVGLTYSSFPSVWEGETGKWHTLTLKEHCKSAKDKFPHP